VSGKHPLEAHRPDHVGAGELVKNDQCTQTVSLDAWARMRAMAAEQRLQLQKLQTDWPLLANLSTMIPGTTPPLNKPTAGRKGEQSPQKRLGPHPPGHVT